MTVAFEEGTHFVRTQFPPEHSCLIVYLCFQVAPHFRPDVLHRVGRQDEPRSR